MQLRSQAEAACNLSNNTASQSNYLLQLLIVIQTHRFLSANISPNVAVHRNLRMKNFQLSLNADESGQENLQFVEDVSKSNNGGLHGSFTNNKNKIVRAYQNAEKPEHGTVKLCKKYIRHVAFILFATFTETNGKYLVLQKGCWKGNGEKCCQKGHE